MEQLWFVKAWYKDGYKTKLYSHVCYDKNVAYLEYNDLKNDKNYFDVSIESEVY